MEGKRGTLIGNGIARRHRPHALRGQGSRGEEHQGQLYRPVSHCSFILSFFHSFFLHASLPSLPSRHEKSPPADLAAWPWHPPRGPIDTPMLAGPSVVATGSATGSVDGTKLCIERRGTPDEVARLIAFLLGEESSYTTGACYTVDGGYMA